MKQLIIEIDITHRCNLICRHCNRLCNAENQYAIVRNSLDMDMRHIDYLCREIKSVSKGSIGTIRILGGEPLLSKILEPTVQVFKLLKDEGYISNINIVTNDTLPIPVYCSPYIVFAPQIVGQIIKEKCRPLTKDEIYSIKNIKHRNITLSPEDIGADYKICERVNICGVHYTVYGFSYTAPCFPCIMAKQSNHKYFLHEFPKDISMFLGENFENDVCSLCTYAIENYKLYANKHPKFQSWNHCGTKWKNLILSNKVEYIEPDTSWINKV